MHGKKPKPGMGKNRSKPTAFGWHICGYPQAHCIALYTTPNKLDVHFAWFKTKWTGHNVVKQSRNVGAYSCQKLKREPAWMFIICISSWLLLKRKAKLLGNMLDFFCKYWATVLQNHNHYCYTQCKNMNIQHSRFSTISFRKHLFSVKNTQTENRNERNILCGFPSNTLFTLDTCMHWTLPQVI